MGRKGAGGPAVVLGAGGGAVRPGERDPGVVIPAPAGIQSGKILLNWIPACAGMTMVRT